jgi:hypothetical protein
MIMTKTKTSRALAISALLLALSAGSALAAAHDNIVLRLPDGSPVTDLNGLNNAFSMKATCGAAQCHDGSGTGVMAIDVNEIEKHSYHAQLSANEHEGFNSFNPDGTAWEAGAGPKGKNWVQGQGHLGAW